MTEKEKQLMQVGNISIKLDASSNAKLQAYKCPFVKCSAMFFDYKDLQTHKVLAHGELPTFFKPDKIMNGDNFSSAKLRKLKMYNTKFMINTYVTMLKLYLGGNKKVVKEPKLVKTAKPKSKIRY